MRRIRWVPARAQAQRGDVEFAEFTAAAHLSNSLTYRQLRVGDIPDCCTSRQSEEPPRLSHSANLFGTCRANWNLFYINKVKRVWKHGLSFLLTFTNSEHQAKRSTHTPNPFTQIHWCERCSSAQDSAKRSSWVLRSEDGVKVTCISFYILINM